MAQFVIPTIFTARDNMSSVIMRMQGTMNGLNTTANRTALSFKNIGSQVLAYAGAGSGIATVASGLVYSGRSIMDYERELANLRALTGVTGKDFEIFKTIIQSTAKVTKTSSVEVAKSFTTVANAMPELLQSAEGLGLVTNASILLAKAARMELAPAADAVTNILNQFGKGAKDARRLVDMMAAGSKYGSAEIEDLTLSLREFAAQAKLAGVNVNESVAITELVSKFRKGTQAGVELRNVLLYLDTLKGQDPKALKDLKRLGVDMNLVADKTKPLSVRLIELGKISKDAAAIFHVFGKENSAMASNLLQNADKLETFIQKIGEVGVANQMATENTDTLYIAVQQLGAKWQTLITGSKGSSVALAVVTGVVHLLTNNMEILLAVLVPAIGLWVTYKTVMLGVRAAMWVYNVATGIAYGLTGNLSIALAENTVAAKAETIAIRVRTAALWLANEASVALQATLTLGLSLAIAGIGYAMTSNTPKIDAYADSVTGLKKEFKALQEPIDNATIAMLKYNDAVDAYNQKRNAIALHQYELERNPIRTRLKDMFSINAIWDDNVRAAIRNEAGPAPRMSDYKDIDTSMPTEQLNEQGAVGNNNVHYTKDKNGELKIIIDNKTGNGISVDQSNAGVPVQVKQTGNYRR